MEISEIHYQSVETTYKNILGLKISDDILAVILITLFVFIVGGMGRWLYAYVQKIYKKRGIKHLVGISVQFMDEEISTQLGHLLTFIEVLKNKNLKDISFTVTYPYQIKTILTIPHNDLYMTYKKNSAQYNNLITNIHLISAIFDELKKLYYETIDALTGYQEDWHKSNIQFVQMYDKYAIKAQNNDALFNSIRTLYVDWMNYGNTRDLVRALKFFNDFIVNCKKHLPDDRALSFIHLANDISNIIKNYQSKTVFYSETFNDYKNTLTQTYQELKDAIT